MTEYIICKDLCFHWSNGAGIKKLNLSVNRGELTSLIGRNGSGKTTLLSLIMGQLIPNDGALSVMGEYINFPHDVKYRDQIGYCPAHSILIENMTIKENYELISFLRNGKKNAWKDQEKWIEQFNFHQLMNNRIDELSSGQKRRVMIVSSLISSPPILLMDEPGNDLDIEGLYILKNLLKNNVEDKAILLSTHILDVIRNMNGKAIFLEKGEIVHEGKIISEKTLEETYEAIIWGNC